MTPYAGPRAMLLAVALAVIGSVPSWAQLAAPNDAGVSTGHVHLTVPDVARHREIWTRLGGVPTTSGPLQAIAFPGLYVLLTEGTPAAPSSETSANHVGFSVRDYAATRDRLQAAGASFFFENAEDGQLIADLPGGVRIEILTDRAQTAPIAFHHLHLSTLEVETLRGWYVDVFGAEPGERRGLPSAIVPGGRVDFLPARGDAPRGSRGAAIDHIGFEVADMDAFAARLGRLGIPFDVERALITDPAGTLIEITDGLAGLQ